MKLKTTTTTINIGEVDLVILGYIVSTITKTLLLNYLEKKTNNLKSLSRFTASSSSSLLSVSRCRRRYTTRHRVKRHDRRVVLVVQQGRRETWHVDQCCVPSVVSLYWVVIIVVFDSVSRCPRSTNSVSSFHELSVVTRHDTIDLCHDVIVSSLHSVSRFTAMNRSVSRVTITTRSRHDTDRRVTRHDTVDTGYRTR